MKAQLSPIALAVQGALFSLAFAAQAQQAPAAASQAAPAATAAARKGDAAKLDTAVVPGMSTISKEPG